MKKSQIISVWIFLGIISSLLSFLFGSVSIDYTMLICFLLGFSFGLGIPSCFAYFSDSTEIEGRGRHGGVAFCAINLCMPVVGILSNSLSFNGLTSVSAIWRSMGLVGFLFFNHKKQGSSEKLRLQASARTIFSDRAFLLYLLAWLMFCFVDNFEGPLLRPHVEQNVAFIMIIFGPVIGGFSSLIGGFLSDTIGRKRITIYGFILLGLAYAVLGIAPRAPISWYLYNFISSISWGFFIVLFFLVIWADLSKTNAREGYCMTGVTTLFVVELVGLFSIEYVKYVPEYAAFSVASFFLFLAVLPVIFAPETLPEKKIRERELRKYVEKAKKIREKHA